MKFTLFLVPRVTIPILNKFGLHYKSLSEYTEVEANESLLRFLLDKFPCIEKEEISEEDEVLFCVDGRRYVSQH